ncbi:MAG: trigger factor [Alphaproteobacteria bacterium]|nr:trigger factor [Alphaproteobacteria bacterium]
MTQFQVKEEKVQGLSRSFTITMSKADFEGAVTKQLEAIGKRAKIQGFRPGKAPLTIIRQRYGNDAQAEVLDRLMKEGSQKAMEEHHLRPATQPKVDNLIYGEDKDMSFTLELEVLPPITPMDFSSLAFEKQVAQVEDKTVDEAVERISKSMRQPQKIEESRAVKMGDVAVIDYDGTVDGVAHEGMKGEDHALELGSNSFIQGFEEQVAGMNSGDKKDIKVTFPDPYHAAHLAGKEAVFAVTLKEIRAHKPVVMDDDLAKEIGFPSLEKLRDRIRKDVGENYAKISRDLLKRKLMDALADGHDFELPQAMVDTEFNGIWMQVEKEKEAGKLDAEDSKKSLDVLKEDYRAIAARRVKLGLLLAHVAELNKIEVSQNELRQAIMEQARRYPGQEQAVIEYFAKSQGAIEQLRAPILEDKVIDFILDKASITEKAIDAETLIKLPEEI